MLLTVLLALLSCAATALTYLGCPTLSLWWLLPVWLGYGLAAVLVYVLILVLGLVLVRRESSSPRLTRYHGWFITHTLRFVMILLGVRYRVSGTEQLPKEPYLLVCNHLSAFDPLVTISALNTPSLRFVAKAELFRIPVLNTMFDRVFMLPIDRKNPRSAVATFHKAAHLITGSGLSYGIYPEGTRSKDGNLLPFQHGSFKIAKMAGCPVVVASLRAKRRRLLPPSPVELRILGTLDAETVKANPTTVLCQQAEQLIREDLGQ